MPTPTSPDALPMGCVADLSEGSAREDGSTDDCRAEEVFALVYRQMHALAGGRRADLDDLVQSATENALRALPSFEGRARLSTWTYRICYLTLLKQERWYRRWLRRFSLTDDGELPDVRAAAEGADPLVEAERAEHLHRALRALSPKQRAVVVMHDLSGMSIEEIAEIVAAKPVAVRSRLRDGRAALARSLARDPVFSDRAAGAEGKGNTT